MYSNSSARAVARVAQAALWTNSTLSVAKCTRPRRCPISCWAGSCCEIGWDGGKLGRTDHDRENPPDGCGRFSSCELARREAVMKAESRRESYEVFISHSSADR